MFTREAAAVIVTYNPDIGVFGQLLTALDTQCHAVIVDNGSTPDVLEAIDALLERHGHAELIRCGQNLGIAHAQNRAIRSVLDNHPAVRLVLLLDHDSIPEAGMIATLMRTHDTLTAAGHRVAATGPVLYDPRDGSLLKLHRRRLFYWGKIRPEDVDPGRPAVAVDNLNSSGTLVSLEAYRDIGGLDEQLFIDHVETDWCFRARAAGYSLYATTEARLTHLMGDDICSYWFFGRKFMPYRSPARHYYLARNSMLLQKRGHVPLAWKFSNLLKLCFTYLYFGWYHPDRAMHRRQIGRGIRDGLKGVTGKSVPNPQEQTT
ncbi:MAG: glycosyltransferase family 2 protein [Thiohalobacterales bacterium]|nr:glycosyltransferase family 2 protein [Thiohalobacterales bacterium]